MNKISFESNGVKPRAININGTNAVPTGVINKNGRLYAEIGEERIDLRRVARQDLYSIIKMCMEKEQAAKEHRKPQSIEEFAQTAMDFYHSMVDGGVFPPSCKGFMVGGGVPIGGLRM